MQAIRDAGGIQGAKLRHVKQESKTSSNTTKEDVNSSLTAALKKRLSTIQVAHCGDPNDEDNDEGACDNVWDDPKKDKVIKIKKISNERL